MGAAIWLASGALALVVARFVPLGRRPQWLAELGATVGFAFVLGLIATALDFGGWREPDPRAALFCALGSLAMIGIIRLLRS
jgi:hypothetical protein